MRMQPIIAAFEALKDEGLIDSYAIGGAVGATFYLEPVATVDVDVFITIAAAAGKSIIDPTPLFRFMSSIGHSMDGEYVIISGWPVQFLAAGDPLLEEAVNQAASLPVEGVFARVMTAEHLAAICLQTGRAKDKARLLHFLEAGALSMNMFETIVTRHHLSQKWNTFRKEFALDV